VRWWVLGLNGERRRSGHLEKASDALVREHRLRIPGSLWLTAMFWLEVATSTKGDGPHEQSHPADRVMATSREHIQMVSRRGTGRRWDSCGRGLCCASRVSW